MTRLARLASPALVCLVIGLAQLLAWSSAPYSFEGGLVTLGLYAAALQLTWSLFAVAAVDDLRRGTAWVGRRRRRRAGWRDIATRPVGFRRALAAFYLRLFLPVAVLAYGVGISVTAVVGAAVGSEQYDELGQQRMLPGTEVVLIALWLLGTVALVLAGGAPRAVVGFVAGFGLAAAQAELVFPDDVALALPSWSVAAVVLGVLGGTAAAVLGRRRTRA